MKFNELNVTSKRSRKRVGRGIAAGQGKTAGRGTKGQKARTGGGVRPGFEGGQTPLANRLPKLRGFKALKPKATTIYTGQLDQIKGTVDNYSLAEAGIVSSPYSNVKLVLKGEINRKVDVRVQAASKSAIEAIRKAGGTFEAVSRMQRSAKTEDTK